MPRYIATVEFQDGEYFTSFPGIEKAYSVAKRPEDIIPHARNFLQDHTKYGSPPPPSLDAAITDPDEPFEGVRLVVFEWDPPPRTGYRIVGYEHDEVLIEMPVPVAKIDLARQLANVPASDPDLATAYPLTKEVAAELVALPPLISGLISAFFLEADRE